MQISKKIFFLAVMGIGFIVSVSYIEAQLENVTFQELEIIEDPNRPGYYTYIFNVCDQKFAIEDPVIMVKSDLEKKPLQLSRAFNSDECYSAVEKIRANDPDSIHTILVLFGSTKQIDNIEWKIDDLEAKSKQLHIELQEAMKNRFPDNHQKYIDDVRVKSDALWATNKELQHLTAQYYEMMHEYHPEQ